MSKTMTNRGAIGLRRYLDKAYMSVPEFSRRVGVSQQAVYRWTWGHAIPSDANKIAIATATCGAVRAADWLESPLDAHAEAS